MNENAKLNRQLRAMINKASRALAAARAHIKTGDYDFASSRSYYAAFYSMEAVLLQKGLVYSKHSGVIAGFAQHYIGSGIFPKDFSKRIARLFRDRQTGDYEFDMSISADEAKEDVVHAEIIVSAIRIHLGRGGPS